MHNNLGNFVVLGVNTGTCADTEILLRGIGVYACYRTFCELKHRPSDDPVEIYEMLRQFAKEGVRGQPRLGHLLDGSWLAWHGRDDVAAVWEGAEDDQWD